ncbi:glycoside hydrolase family 65 protein [Paenibacillus antibioticophila]|uniref:glycoside hydrolase family 65 protein n=1 Tax=Paenibacillus antibioticophila TaxID=1274374 RepID=UPI0005C9ED38|nr:glycosyl hydrolase family 65 protein [Paenibacillus antibioticophila]
MKLANQDWLIRENGFDRNRIAADGNKFMIGNGYMGCRGTMEEYTKDQLAAVTLAGLYDQVDGKWREPVNAPHPLYAVIEFEGQSLSVLDSEPVEHEQALDIRSAVHHRRTVFKADRGAELVVESERFCSAERRNVIAGRLSVTCSANGQLTIRTGINGEVWDINGPHLEKLEAAEHQNSLLVTAVTRELQVPLAVAERISSSMEAEEREAVTMEVRYDQQSGSIFRTISFACRAGKTYTFDRFAAVCTGLDEEEPGAAALRLCREAAGTGYAGLLAEHEACWERKWALADVVIEGDDEALLALRYSLYQLLIIAPEHSEKLSIPARGLSGQVYKGAVFWDTEMFMLPFFLYTQPETARNLVMYRIHTLDGARRKAAEYGYEGAFYAWESQETGDDACTLFNVNDVFTGRPMRTYFRDKQVHISADAAYGIWEYYKFTGDEEILLQGGAETVWECARFFYSYAYYNPLKQRYEVLDVTGPDEYHERVNNNAFTNAMVKRTLFIALEAMEILHAACPEQYEALVQNSAIKPEHIRDMHDRLYVPEPDSETGLIEQFDRYFTLEDIPLSELKGRVVNKHEYWGGGNGLATTTQILKQADIVLMLHLFKDAYDTVIKKANWAYYEPRTEHGSSLSACIYAMVAADTGSPDWGYPYFMRTATIDLTGESKQYVGDLYIGGTHPAANGGAWMAAVQGFAGIRFDGECAMISPSLPEKWQAVQTRLVLRGQQIKVRVGRQQVELEADAGNTSEVRVAAYGQSLTLEPGVAAVLRREQGHSAE